MQRTMAENSLEYLHKIHSDGEKKYSYFLLAIAASAVAFLVQKTESAIFTWPLAFVALALVCWSLSFLFGCLTQQSIQHAIRSNYILLQLQKGTHPNQPSSTEEFAIAKEITNKNIDRKMKNAGFFSVWQFRLLVIGAGFFLVWHIIEIAIRTINHSNSL